MLYHNLNGKQKELFQKLLADIKSNKDITCLLDKENRKDIKAVLIVRNDSDWSSAGSLLFHAIGKKGYARLVFSKNKNLGNAKKIIEFARKHEIFKDMLGKYFNKGIVNELSRKNELPKKNGQIYIYDELTVIDTIEKQNKCDNYYAGTATCGAVLVLAAVVAAVSLYEYTMMATTNLKGRDTAAMLFALGTIVSVFALLGVITCLCIALNNRPTVEKLEKNGSQQESQNDTSTQLPSSSMKEESYTKPHSGAKLHRQEESLGQTL